MPGWLLNGVYTLLLIACSPLIVWRAVRHGRYRRGWKEKLFGLLPVRANKTTPLLWLHAVSVGEVLLLQPLVKRLRQARPELQLLISVGTDTGYDTACSRLADCTITWCPLDFTWATRRAMRRVRPDLLVLVELELWPNLIRATAAADVPLALVNARVSERSFRGYSRIRFLIAPLLRCFNRLLVQDHEYAARLRQLGANPESLHVTGSIKFDKTVSASEFDAVGTMRSLLSLSETATALTAGSTQSPEESMAIETWLALRPTNPELRLILVPRHRERFDEVARLVEARGLPLVRRSQLAKETTVDPNGVILIDTIGELDAIWGLTSIAYVGGSLLPGRGGQNMLEPAAYGAAVLLGPHTENFRQIVASLRKIEGAVVVHSPEEFTQQVARLLDHPQERLELGRRARSFVQSQQGATERTMAQLLPLLPGSPHSEHHSDRDAA